MNAFRRSIKGIVMVVVLLATLLSTNMVGVAQRGAPNLFGDADGSSADAAYKQPVQVIRFRYVNVNMNLLLDSTGQVLDVASIPAIALNLFTDANYTGVVTRVENTPGVSVSWIGVLKGVENGYFYVVRADNAVIVHVASPLGTYEVSMVGENVYRVVQLDQTKFGEDAPREMPAPGPVLSIGDLGPNADTGAIIDVMALYTATTRAAEGSTAAMKARIALAVTETNNGYLNAGIAPRLRLVHTEEVAYAETGNIGTDLNRLTNPSDGFIDYIHTVRNVYAADMVTLIVENGGAYCGLANAIMATAANAFQVTARSCATGYYSFGHEFGHLQGARHDTYVDPTNSPYAYGHGYLHPSAITAQSWRTVMAYNTGCSDFGYDCKRLQYWSNPTRTYIGAPMGVVGVSENYKVLNITAYTVANFRSSVIGNNFYSTFNTSAAGWIPVYGPWALVNGAQYRTSGVANFWASARYARIYGDLTYQARLYRSGASTYANSLLFRGNASSLAADKTWNSTYWFSYSNAGYFSIYKRVGGTITTIKTWTTSTAIVANGWNTLKVVAVGPLLRFYINGVLVWTVTDTSLRVGNVGLMMARGAVANYLYVDYATVSTTPTADVNFDEVVASGVEVPGGDPSQPPLP